MSQCCTDCCTEPCDTCQSFCETGNQWAQSTFFWNKGGSPVCVEKGQIISPNHFNVEAWNSIITEFNNIYRRGNAGFIIDEQEPYRTTGDIKSKYMSAAEFNRVCSMLTQTGNNAEHLKRQPGDVIKGSYFQDLEALMHQAYYGQAQCDTCNTGCDNCNAECGDCGDCCDTDSG